jgi:hypothetical protein
MNGLSAAIIVGILTVSGASMGATFTTNPTAMRGQTGSLTWCLSQALSGDTIIMQPGYYTGPLELTKDLVVFGSRMNATVVVAPYNVVRFTGCNVTIRNVTFLSSVAKSYAENVCIRTATVRMDSVAVSSSSALATGLLVEGASRVTLNCCDLSKMPPGCFVRLADCPTNFVTINCTWPSTDQDYLSRRIWDKGDDSTLGLVIR